MSAAGTKEADHIQNGDVRRKYEKRQYKKECTIRISTGYDKIKAGEIIDAIEYDFGEDTVFACTPGYGYFEVTVCDRDTANILCGGVTIGEKEYTCKLVTDKTIVVSFMHLPSYIEDHEIHEVLESFGIKPVSEIRRHFITHNSKKVADGTRYVRCQFPPNVKSMPYAVSFNTCDGKKQYKVIHNGQLKTCNKCLSVDHMYADCPENKCFKCGKMGHLARACSTEKLCEICGEFKKQCTCGQDISEGEEEEMVTSEYKRSDPFSQTLIPVGTAEEIAKSIAEDWSYTPPVRKEENNATKTDSGNDLNNTCKQILTDDIEVDTKAENTQNAAMELEHEVSIQENVLLDLTSKKQPEEINKSEGTRFKRITGITPEKIRQLTEERKRKASEKKKTRKQMKKEKTGSSGDDTHSDTGK